MRVVKAEFIPHVTAIPTIVINLIESVNRYLNLHRTKASTSYDGRVSQMPSESYSDDFHHKKGNKSHQNVESCLRYILGYFKIRNRLRIRFII